MIRASIDRCAEAKRSRGHLANWGIMAFVGITASGFGLAACGSRGPLDADGPLDASTDAAASEVKDAAPDVAPPSDAGPEGGSIVGCGTCLLTQCSSGLATCALDASCRSTFQCVVTQCLAGGGAPSTSCLASCASGNPQGALQIFQILQCVTGKCGADCTPLLGGALGGLGGIGGGGPKPEPPPHAFIEALSPWPTLCEPRAPEHAPIGPTRESKFSR
jgi:hypothetical protein